MKGVWLIGFRGSGKTTFGRQLAEHLGWDFLDVDEEWEKRNQRTILSFAEKEGIASFRLSEQHLLEEISARMRAGEKALLVATGGGFVDWPASREILELSACPKLFLNPPAELLWERLQKNKERLEIGNLASIEGMRALLEIRRPFYEKISTAVCEYQDISEILLLVKSLRG